MRIIYYIQHFSTNAGAAGTRSYEIARRLAGYGHDVTVVCGSYELGETGLKTGFHHKKREGDVEGIHVVELCLPYANRDRFCKRCYTFLRFALRSIGIALSARYDLLFATSTPLTAALPGIIAHLLRRKPFIFEVRDLWPELPRVMGVIHSRIFLRLLDWLEWSAYHASERCIGLSPGIVRGIVKRGIAPERVTMIPNGCSLDVFADVADADVALPEGVDPNALRAIFTGSHGIANGLDAALDAAQELLRRGRRDIQCIFIGDGKLKSRLRQRAQTDRLTNCIFLAPVSKRQLALLIKQMDVGLMLLANIPAFYDGTSPNKFFDYLAAGLPVLNNYPGWLAEMIRANMCGVVVPPDNPAAFADALEQLADHRDELKRMGRRSCALAQQFDWDRLAQRFNSWICGKNFEEESYESANVVVSTYCQKRA